MSYLSTGVYWVIEFIGLKGQGAEGSRIQVKDEKTKGYLGSKGSLSSLGLSLDVGCSTFDVGRSSFELLCGLLGSLGLLDSLS